MASAAGSSAAGATINKNELSLTRLYVMRAIYLLIGLGEGSQVAPGLFVHELNARGVDSGPSSGNVPPGFAWP